MKKCLIPVLLLIISCTSKITIPEAQKNPVPASDYENSKISEGIELHDKGFLKEAVQCYREVLQLNPDNIQALYEMSYSYFQMGDQENSLKYSLKGMQYRSDLLSQFYMNAGNSLDIMGKARQAVDIYKRAISIDPAQNMFYYNMGIAWLRLDDLQKAENSFVASLRLNPDHASSHYALADMYMQRGQQIPAILLLCKFLIIEPNSERSLIALDRLAQALAAGVSQEDDKNISVNIFGLSDKTDNPFSSIEMFYKLSRVSRYNDENKDKSEIELRENELSALLSFMDKKDLKDENTFMQKYLISYFSDLAKAGQTETFIYYIHQAWDDKTVQQWLRLNWPRIEAFEKWKQQYRLSIY